MDRTWTCDMSRLGAHRGGRCRVQEVPCSASGWVPHPARPRKQVIAQMACECRVLPSCNNAGYRLLPKDRITTSLAPVQRCKRVESGASYTSQSGRHNGTLPGRIPRQVQQHSLGILKDHSDGYKNSDLNLQVSQWKSTISAQHPSHQNEMLRRPLQSPRGFVWSTQ